MSTLNKGQTYAADTDWLEHCNGLIAAASDSVTDAGGVSSCGTQSAWNDVQVEAQGIGMYDGDSDPAGNYAVTAYTQAEPSVGSMLQTNAPIALASANRFLLLQADTAAENCAIASHPLIQFNLLDSSKKLTPIGDQVDTCSFTKTEIVPPVGQSNVQTVTVGTAAPTTAVLWKSKSVGINVTNEQPTGQGNDGAFDNVVLTDVTPQLGKQFSPASIKVGQTSTLTFTITNTTELAAKPGWSFSDSLPAGLEVSSAGTSSTTCPNGTVSGASGATKIDVAGDLSQGMTSCTVTVPVLGAKAGSYVNGPDNVVGSGVNPPADTTLKVTGVPEPGTRSFSVTKTASAKALAPGDVQSYTIVVKNTGTVGYTAAEPATFTDDMSGVLDDASFDGRADTTNGTTQYASPKLTWTGVLGVGASVRVTYEVKVDDPDSGDRKLVNAVTTPAGLGGNCASGSGGAGCATDTPVTVPVPVPPSSSGTVGLASTGANSSLVFWIAMSLLVAGVALTALGRRRHLGRHTTK